MHFGIECPDAIDIALVQVQNSIADPIGDRDGGGGGVVGDDGGDESCFDRAIDVAATPVAIAANLDCSFRLAIVPRWLCNKS